MKKSLAFIVLMAAAAACSKKKAPSVASAEWTPGLPPATEEQVQRQFGAEPEKRKAAVQYAKATWAFLDTERELSERTHTLDRALVCLRRRFARTEDANVARQIQALVLSNTKLIKLYLAEDARTGGDLEDLPQGEVCDS